MGPNNSQLVACGDSVVIVATRNATAAGGVVAVVGGVATDNVVFVVGATTAIAVWVQRCLMRPCRSPQFHFVSVVVTLMGKELSW